MAKKTSELTTFGLVPLASILAGFVVAALLCLFVVRGSIHDEYRTAVAERSADRLRQQLDIKQQQMLSQLTNLGTNARLVEVVTSGDATAKSIEETAVSALVPDSIRARIFSLGEAEIDRNSIPPFSFTSLDLVNRVESGEVVFPEAINANGRWIISVATPIKSEGRIVGTVFIYLESTSLARQIQENVDGQLNLTQRVGNAAPQEVLSIGSGAQPGASAITRELDNPSWTIQYLPSPALANQTLSNPLVFLAPAVAFLIIGIAGVLIGIKRIVSNIKHDVELLNRQLSAASSDTFEASPDYAIRGFFDLDARLALLGSKSAKQQPVPKVAVGATVREPEPTMEAEVVDIEMTDDGSFADAFEDSEVPESPVLDDTEIASIFRAYDVRGVAGSPLSEEVAHAIGLAIGSEAEAQGEQTLVVGADGRTSSPDLTESLIKGLLASGRHVVNIGRVPTPMLYFATENSDARSGVMVTGSHNPPEYNGFKIILAGKTLAGAEIAALHDRIQTQDYTEGEGELTEIDICDDYMDAILDDVVVAQPLKVVLDCSNGIAGDYAPDIISNLGCEVVPLYCDVDGTFPNHPPDPTIEENLEDLILTVRSQEADIGIALDGDADRVVAVTHEGDIVAPDRLLMLFAKDVVARNPGSDVVYDIKCTRHLNGVISGFGGRPIICRSGHSYLKEKISETDAVLGSELSGHICFGERWFGFDDGIYAAARLIEIVGAQTERLSTLLEEFPESIATPEILVPVEDSEKFDIIQQLSEIMDFEDGAVTELDGIRVDFADGWGLVQASNTNPYLTLRFEADDQDALGRIQGLFRDQLSSVREDLSF